MKDGDAVRNGDVEEGYGTFEGNGGELVPAATENNHRLWIPLWMRYYLALGVVLLAEGGESGYFAFSREDASGGLYLFSQTFFSYPAPYSTANNPDTGWENPLFQAPGVSFSALDLAVNLGLLHLRQEALAAAGLTLDKDGNFTLIPIQDNESLILRAVTLFFSSISIGNFVNGAFADVVGVNSAFKHSSDEVRKRAVLGSGVCFVPSGVAYYCLLSLQDVKNHIKEFAKGRDSVFVILFKHDGSAFAMAVSRALVTHISRTATFGLIAEQALEDVFDISSTNTRPFIVLAGVFGFITSFLTRTMPMIQRYLEPFKSDESETGYDFRSITQNDRDELWSQLSFAGKAKVSFPALFLGSIRGLTIGYLTHGLVNNDLIQAINAILSYKIFQHAFRTDFQHELNVKVIETRKADQPAQISRIAKLISTFMNTGSQLARSFISIRAAELLHSKFGWDLMDAVVFMLWISGEVAPTNYAYFKTKLVKTIPNYLNDLSGLMTKFSNCFSSPPRTKESSSEGPYQRLREDLTQVEEMRNPESQSCWSRWGCTLQ